jgi:hypothetical protein
MAVLVLGGCFPLFVTTITHAVGHDTFYGQPETSWCLSAPQGVRAHRDSGIIGPPASPFSEEGEDQRTFNLYPYYHLHNYLPVT